jgi:hypothetical protein
MVFPLKSFLSFGENECPEILPFLFSYDHMLKLKPWL